MDNQLAHIFLVEDDASLASLVSDYLTMQSFKVTVEARGDLAIDKIMASDADLIILDIMLPGKNGLDICRELRPQTDVPIVMLTARSDEIDQIVGLEVGADDYIPKPVQPRLLLARINALLRRAKVSASKEPKAPEQSNIVFGALEINKLKQEVYLDGQSIDLTTNEYELLNLFALSNGKVLSRDDLLSNLRGIGYDGMDRTIDMLVSRLRKKLGDDSSKPFKIKTIWKKGYLFVADAW